MNTTASLPTPDQMSTHNGVEQLHTQVMAFTDEHGIDLFIFSRDGRILDSSVGPDRQPIEQMAALCSTLVNYSRGYSTVVNGAGVTRVVTRYGNGSVVLLPISEVVWVGAMVARDQVIHAAHQLTLFTDQVAELVPHDIDQSLQMVPTVLAEKG